MELKSLIDLEELDIQIAQLEKSKMTYPADIAEMESRLEQQRARLSSIKQKEENRQLEADSLQKSIAENNRELDHSQEKLSAVTTNREYDAVLLELSERKAMIERGERKIKKLHDELLSLKESYESEKVALKSLEDELQPEIDSLKSKVSTIDVDIVNIKSQRDLLVSEVPESYYRLYTTISSNRKSGRVLSVIGKDIVCCSYCYQVISPNSKKKAQESTSPVTCENCGSIFIWKK